MRIIVAMTGATGAVYGVRLLAALGEMKIETHLVLSRWAEVTLRKETGLPRASLQRPPRSCIRARIRAHRSQVAPSDTTG